VWVDAPGDGGGVGAALARRPFDALDVTTRVDVEEGLRGDPLARAALLTLASAALVALVLAVLGLLLGVVADVRDERGELFDLEAQGAAPATLRRQVRLRAGIVAAVGVAGGAATGAVLSVLVTDLVRLTANAARPEPPLVLAVDWALVALAVAAYALVSAAVVGVATARAFRAPVPATSASGAGL
jgi:ABC-type lipoprotein release transport system permease subunit